MRGKWMHRKLWEWAIISEALSEREMLRPGKKGLGFAVGREPLASLFANRGSTVLASDLVSPTRGANWSETGQLAASRDSIRWPKLISGATFSENLHFQNIDMRDLSSFADEQFDYSWSSCSFEHLGSLEAGMKFVLDSMRLIKSGGVGVHTTEYNITSNDETIVDGDSVIYRRSDIELLDRRLRANGCGIESLDFDPGTESNDLLPDRPPYYQSGRQHLKLEMMGHISTSICLIIRKG
jgi:hypothetical protein